MVNFTSQLAAAAAALASVADNLRAAAQKKPGSGRAPQVSDGHGGQMDDPNTVLDLQGNRRSATPSESYQIAGIRQRAPQPAKKPSPSLSPLNSKPVTPALHGPPPPDPYSLETSPMGSPAQSGGSGNDATPSTDTSSPADVTGRKMQPQLAFDPRENARRFNFITKRIRERQSQGASYELARVGAINDFHETYGPDQPLPSRSPTPVIPSTAPSVTAAQAAAFQRSYETSRRLKAMHDNPDTRELAEAQMAYEKAKSFATKMEGDPAFRRAYVVASQLQSSVKANPLSALTSLLYQSR